MNFWSNNNTDDLFEDMSDEELLVQADLILENIKKATCHSDMVNLKIQWNAVISLIPEHLIPKRD